MSFWEIPWSTKIVTNGRLSLTYHTNNKMQIFVDSLQHCDDFCWYMSIFIRFPLISCQVLLINDQPFCWFSPGVVDFYLLFAYSSILLVVLVRFMSVPLIFFLIFLVLGPIFVGFFVHFSRFCWFFSVLVIFINFCRFLNFIETATCFCCRWIFLSTTYSSRNLKTVFPWSRRDSNSRPHGPE